MPAGRQERTKIKRAKNQEKKYPPTSTPITIMDR